MRNPSQIAKDTRVGGILDEYLRAVEAGNAPDRETLLARNVDVAEELAAALRGLDLVRGAAPGIASAGDGEFGTSLGDYRLLHEVGRGGMAVVYEAEQVSLGRRVALKVLPFAAVLDPKQLQRFKNEALAAAHLRHPNIVPVYAVGCERGVHYYAMQYVEGQSLALAIRDLKRGGTGEGAKTPISSHGSNRERSYIRLAAALGKQAAEALDHAHQLGIVHRDVKPGNLLVDEAGTLWVTDFGLARSVADVGLTMTGEILGTIRYMSPEQALAKRVPIDHRTDVYSLGATLYELFTLEPAFPGDDPHRVMQDIAFREPVSPRRLNPAVPRDLETVLLKAMSKDPAGRYATAQEMADDLRRYLEEKPVVARRPSASIRVTKWARRHRGLVAASLALLLLGIAALAADAYRVGRALQRAESNLRLARESVDRFLVAVGVSDLEDRPLPPPARIELLEKALEFHESYLDDPASYHTRAVVLHALHRYEEALAACDRMLAVTPRDPRALVERSHMLWHLERYDEMIPALETAITIDPLYADAHFFLGNALDGKGDPDGAIAAFQRAIRLGAPAHVNLGNALSERGNTDAAIEAYRQAIRMRPGDALARSNLGAELLEGKGDPEAAVAVLREATRLQPDYADAHTNLGHALSRLRRFEEALDAYDRAIEIDALNAWAHDGRGKALAGLGELDGALGAFDRAIEIDADRAMFHTNRGNTLRNLRRFEEALIAYERAIEIDPRYPAHNNRGGVLCDHFRRYDEALAAFDRAIELDPQCLPAHQNRARALACLRRFDEALAACDQALDLDPQSSTVHHLRSTVLHALGQFDEALAACDQALKLDPRLALAHLNRGYALRSKGNLVGAIEACREAIRLDQELAEAHCVVGRALMELGHFQEAVSEFRKGHELGSKRPGWDEPSLEWVADAERKAQVEARLEPVLSGAERPSDAAERVEFAAVLHAKARYAESGRMWVAAFAEDPALAEDLGQWHRYAAACSAALAAAGGAEDASAWRGRALAWLRADLRAREKAATELTEDLAHWKRDPDFAGVRDRVAELPSAEREEWTKLWAEVDALLAGAGK